MTAWVTTSTTRREEEQSRGRKMGGRWYVTKTGHDAAIANASNTRSPPISQQHQGPTPHDDKKDVPAHDNANTRQPTTTCPTPTFESHKKTRRGKRHTSAAHNNVASPTLRSDTTQRRVGRTLSQGIPERPGKHNAEVRTRRGKGERRGGAAHNDVGSLMPTFDTHNI